MIRNEPPDRNVKPLDTDQDKIKKICDLLRKDTLEPAEKRAAQILESAQAEASRIILDAEKEAEIIIRKAQAEMEQERKIFELSMLQSGKQGVEMLRQQIQETLFAPELERLISDQAKDSQLIARIIEAIVKAVEREGLVSDLVAYVPKNISPKEISALLVSSVAEKLMPQGVETGAFKGGAKVRLVNKNMTVDMSDDALRELLSAFIRKDFRKWVFGR
ncbi:MAG: V-type ATP synthase subunit E [Gammaproteobacteria bacterium]|jgi:V/A-type H+-transporting ATPase subunit E|nr:MAG: V-type ATP synthase subunit E [Gammaproteobacteria bacterium]